MKEAYCSYKISKLLREKRFDEECTHYYDIDDGTEYTNGARVTNSSTETYCTSPTHQRAMAWLREKNIHIDFYYLPIHKKYMWSVVETKDPKGTGSKELYEDAVETAIKYCLENLI